MTDADADAVLPRLGREALARLTNERAARPAPAQLALPEKVVQFGTGAFLRGFVDYFLDEANRLGVFAGRVVAVASTASGRGIALNEQDGLYTLVAEGAGEGRLQPECRVIASVSRALAAQDDWQEVLSLARSPAIELIFSNTTEVGIAIEDGDRFGAGPPPSFPAKLARFLLERGRASGYADDAGVVVIPCELIDRNGDRLRELVLELARRWEVEKDFSAWIGRAVPFCNTLVDRIVPGMPNASRRVELERALGYRDELMIAAESFRLFAIETNDATRKRLAFAQGDEGIVLTDDVTPFRERKVRILNGGHTLLASVGMLMGCETVLDAVRHESVGAYLRRVLHDEIVPTLTAPNGAAFAQDVLARFANPFLRHALADITLQHTAKMRVRVVPSVVHYADRTGSVPELLAFGFAAYLLLMRQSVRGAPGAPPLRVGPDIDGEQVRGLWRAVADEREETLRGLVARVCGDRALWQTDLAQAAGFNDRVADHMLHMMRVGIRPALETLLDPGATSLRGVASAWSSAT